MADENDDWEKTVLGLRENDPGAVRDFYERYGRTLYAVAEKQIASGFKRRFDADDVVQSAFRTFFRRATGGEFRIEDCEQLWSLLCAITLNKVREKVRFYGRQKRGMSREISVDAANHDDGTSFEIAATGLSPAAATEFTDEFERLMSSLDEEERTLVDLKLQDCTNEEAAVKMRVSERTVRRILNRVKLRLTEHFDVKP